MNRRRRPVVAHRPAPELDVVTVPSWPELRRRLPRLVAGLVVVSSGVGVVIEARFGVAPYDVLHQGLGRVTGLSFGSVVVALGLLILLAWIPLRQRPGVGTILNALTVGFLIDGAVSIVPEPDDLVLRLVMLIGGTLVVGLGIGLYIGAGLGPGPRDGLMTGIAARGHPIWIVRTVLEAVSLLVGWALGGEVGVGTVFVAFSIGPLAHWFLARLHLSAVDGDPDPEATVGE